MTLQEPATREHRIRVYADTSVFGGVFDAKFAKESSAFFEAVRRGEFQLVVSDIVRDEIVLARKEIQDFYYEMAKLAEGVTGDDEAIVLRNAYLKEGVVMAKSVNDAFHVAVAAVNACTMIVSWNFRHIVNYRLIPVYNLVSVRNGYLPLSIYSPSELIGNEDEGYQRI